MGPEGTKRVRRSAAGGVCLASTVEAPTVVAPGCSPRICRSAAAGVFGPGPMEAKSAVTRNHVFLGEGCLGTRPFV